MWGTSSVHGVRWVLQLYLKSFSLVNLESLNPSFLDSWAEQDRGGSLEEGMRKGAMRPWVCTPACPLTAGSYLPSPRANGAPSPWPSCLLPPTCPALLQFQGHSHLVLALL